MATLRSASSPPSDEELLTALSQDIMAMAQRKENPVGDFKIEHSSLAANQILDELRAANQIVTAKATPEEAEGFRAWLSAVAQAAADAAKEGGFMGFHAERVSEGEKAMMAKVAEALGSTS